MTKRFVPVLLFLACLPAAACAVEAGPRLPALLDIAVEKTPAAARAGEAFTLEVSLRAGPFALGSVAVELRGGAFDLPAAPPAFSLPAGGKRILTLSARANRTGLQPLAVRAACDSPDAALAAFPDDPKHSPAEREALRASAEALRALGRPSFARSVTIDVR